MSIRVDRLRKQFGSLVAVDELSFDVATGSVFAFLGANGAGKSTTIGCITTTLAPTSGSISVNGKDVARNAYDVRRSIGVVFQSSILDPLLSVRENLLTRAGFYGLGVRKAKVRVDELSELVGLGSLLDRRYGTLSGGQKRRADIARALVHDPSVLFLDEPTAGLDPQSREQIWRAVQNLRTENGTTVFLTTHYMEETERADDVCIIDHGRIVASGTPAELRARYSTSILTVRTSDIDEVLAALRRDPDYTQQPARDGADLLIPVTGSEEAKRLLQYLDIDDFEFRHGTMDDVFLAVTAEASE
jgi:multidrug/hemolysin transport system ATP-binding protein